MPLPPRFTSGGAGGRSTETGLQSLGRTGPSSQGSASLHAGPLSSSVTRRLPRTLGSLAGLCVLCYAVGFSFSEDETAACADACCCHGHGGLLARKTPGQEALSPLAVNTGGVFDSFL